MHCLNAVGQGMLPGRRCRAAAQRLVCHASSGRCKDQPLPSLECPQCHSIETGTWRSPCGISLAPDAGIASGAPGRMRVAVVGGGLAGVATAWHLLVSAWPVSVLAFAGLMPVAKCSKHALLTCTLVLVRRSTG